MKHKSNNTYNMSSVRGHDVCLSSSRHRGWLRSPNWVRAWTSCKLTNLYGRHRDIVPGLGFSVQWSGSCDHPILWNAEELLHIRVKRNHVSTHTQIITITQIYSMILNIWCFLYLKCTDWLITKKQCLVQTRGQQTLQPKDIYSIFLSLNIKIR